MMGKKSIMLQFFAKLLLVSFFISQTVSAFNAAAGIKALCGTLPHPEPCEHFLTNNSKYGPVKKKSDFLQVSLQLALDRAIHATVHTQSLGSKCRNEGEKAAWADCLELYAYTIHHLNKTLDPTIKSTKADKQTWLSGAMTNLDTCANGFQDLGVADYIFPLMSNNVSKLISNTLALNKVPYGPPSYKEGFPSWVSPGDRKLLQAQTLNPNIVVAQDGSGHYTTISAAIAAASKAGSGRQVIYLKAGTYKENLQITAKNVMLVGAGIGSTIITGSKSVVGGSTTFQSATVGVTGSGFMARGITFQNTAGPQNHQAVAFRSGSDLSVVYQCSFEGYQDTLYVYSMRQFYKNCDIYGTVDFIFGNAAVVIQSCNIYPRRPPYLTNTLTAQGRSDPNQNTGISIHECNVTAAPDLTPVQSSVGTYLGRPWKQYSRTVYLKTYLDSLINPAGWYPWIGNFALNTLYYGEYMNTGPGSSTARRVNWTGYHVIASPAVASQFTVANFIGGPSWITSAGVPVIPGL